MIPSGGKNILIGIYDGTLARDLSYAMSAASPSQDGMFLLH